MYFRYHVEYLSPKTNTLTLTTSENPGDIIYEDEFQVGVVGVY